ncbi:MAG: hypothetical protein MZV65_48135 [Chromatiales bacterium]|nr:hypothetical protein [Chromatiales bacterium]
MSADTLCYFGPLEAVLQAARGALRAQGLLLFTVEEAADRERPNTASTPTDATATAATTCSARWPRAGFAQLAIEPTALRTEGGSPVAGLVVTRKQTGRRALSQRRD